MIRNQKESAVSEVIAITLIVGLTVIMAALVAAYMFGMVPTLPVHRSVAVTASQIDPDTIVITYHGGPDQGSLIGLNISWPKGHRQVITNPHIGDTYTLTNIPHGTDTNVTSGKDHIVVTGIFTNNIQQVILDTLE